MQKFLAIFAVLALVATSAFALDIWAGGRVGFGLSGSTADGDDDIVASWTDWFGVSFSATNDENSAGAKAAIGASSKADGNNVLRWGDPQPWNDEEDYLLYGGLGGYVTVDWIYAWWQPIDMLYLKLGKFQEDGKYWNGPDITAWGFNSNSYMDFMLGNGNYSSFPGPWGYYPDKFYGWWNVFPGGLLSSGPGGVGRDAADNRYGFQATLLPIDDMHLTLEWDFIPGMPVDKVFVSTFRMQAAYTIPGAGTASVSFVNDDADNPAGLRQVGLAYSQGLGDMAIEGAVGIPLPIEGDMPGINVGVGFGYGSPWGDQFWAHARLGAYIGLADGEPMIIGFEVVPSYDLGMFRFYATVGFSMYMPSEGDTWLGWSFCPYIKKDLGVCTLWTGLTVWSQAAPSDAVINYKVPFCLEFSL